VPRLVERRVCSVDDKWPALGDTIIEIESGGQHEKLDLEADRHGDSCLWDARYRLCGAADPVARA
jgi:hypothetical protein